MSGVHRPLTGQTGVRQRTRRPPAMRREVLRVGPTRIRVRTLTGQGRWTFVLVHGIGVSSTYFEPLAHRLHAAGNVLLLDLPGFGGLPQPSRPLTISGFAHLVAAVMRRRGIDRPVLVGHSMGAQVVTELAVRSGSRAPTILIGPPVNAAEPRAHQQALRLLQSARSESMRTRLMAIRSYAQCGPAWFADVLPRMLRYPIADRIGALQAPLLLIRGGHDRVVPADWVRTLAQRHGRARIHTVPGAAHAVVYEHADVTAAAILTHAERT